MLIYANHLKTSQPISFFCQKMRIWYVDNCKKKRKRKKCENFVKRFNKRRENEILGPPYALKC